MSEAPAPTKATMLIDRLDAITWSREGNELKMARIVREANDLLTADPRGANMVLGTAAAARGDAAETRRRYRIALQSDSDYTLRRNYAVALGMLEEHDDALEVTEALYNESPADVGLLEHTIIEAVETGRLEKASSLCDRLSRIAPDRPSLLASPVGHAAAAVAAGSFTEQGVRNVLRGVAETQRRTRIRSVGIRLSSHDAETFLYLRGVHSTPAEAAALNEELAEYIARSPPLLDDPGLRFVAAFRPVDRPA